MSMNISGEYVVALRVDHANKLFAVTRRHRDEANCQVIDNGTHKFLNWDWLRQNKSDKPELNNWPVMADYLSRQAGDKMKFDLIRLYEGLGYTLHNIKGWF